MGFILYKVEKSSDKLEYTMSRKLSLAGTNGALSKWMRTKRDEQTPYAWNLSGEALISALVPDVDPCTHAVVMDMMPERLAGASLCLVASLAGSTDVDESDIIIMMRELSMVSEITSPSDARESFTVDLKRKASDLIESIGISGGTKKGTYRWCPPKMNIGAAVCR